MTQPNSTALKSRGHSWSFREFAGETWNVCEDCGLAEKWANGLLIDSTDWNESERLNEEYPQLPDPPGAGWQE